MVTYVIASSSLRLVLLISLSLSLIRAHAGFSPGVNSLDGYLSNSEGGECLEGFKMVMYVLPIEKATTAIPTTVPTTSMLATATGEGYDATENSTSDKGITQYTDVMDTDTVTTASPGKSDNNV